MMSDIIEALGKNPRSKSSKSADMKFYSHVELDPGNLSVEVEGIGALSYPITAPQIEKLLEVSSKAKFGLKDKTVLNEKVRSTEEIKGDALKVHKSPAFDSMLDHMRKDLGLPGSAKIIPHLHNMLIYKPGQFFKKHQDTEKLEKMVATLVVVLPCAHIGGDLVIEHQEYSYVFSSENIDDHTIKCVSFYADCIHEAKTVKSGHRVALTYNLVLESGPVPLAIERNTKLEQTLEEYFKNHDRLVYVFDHEYTEHSLRWDMLKGKDLSNTLDFFACAKKLDLIPYLTLCARHEYWTTGYDGRYQYSPGPNEVDLEELIEEDTILSYWVNEKNENLSYGDCNVRESEICYTTPNQDLEPDDFEYEGYTGNAGCTASYWYKRAALFLIRKNAKLSMDFELNYQECMKQLLELTTFPGKEKQVIDTIEAAGKQFYQYQYAQSQYFIPLLKIACYIQDESIAQNILEHFAIHHFEEKTTAHLLNLQKTYGVSWTIERIQKWQKNSDKISIPNIGKVIQALIIQKSDIKFPTSFLEYQFNLIKAKHIKYETWRPVDINRDLKERILETKDLLLALNVIDDKTMLHSFSNHLLAHPIVYSELTLSQILSDLPKDDFKDLRSNVLAILHLEINKGLRDPDDWSIPQKLPCTCQDCTMISAFLHCKTESLKIWATPQQFRNHVTESFRGMEMPIDLSVLKQGSPHKLVIRKTEDLYTDAKAKFEKLQEYVQKLESL